MSTLAYGNDQLQIDILEQLGFNRKGVTAREKTLIMRIHQTILGCSDEPEAYRTAMMGSMDVFMSQATDPRELADFIVAWALALEKHAWDVIVPASQMWSRKSKTGVCCEGVVAGCLHVMNKHAGKPDEEGYIPADRAFVDFLGYFIRELAFEAEGQGKRIEWTSNMGGVFAQELSSFIEGASYGATKRMRQRWIQLRGLIERIERVPFIPRQRKHDQGRLLYLKLYEDICSKLHQNLCPFDKGKAILGIRIPADFEMPLKEATVTA